MYFKIDGFFDIPAQVFFDDGPHRLLHLRAVAEETTARDLDGGTGFLQCHELPELGFVAQLHRPFVIPPAAVFLAPKGAGRLVVFVLEVFLHPCGHYYPT